MLDESYPPEVRQNITALTVARLCANSCYRFAPPFLATIARGTHASLDQLGIAIALSELTGMLSPLNARLVDRMTRRAAMAVGLGGVAIGTAVAAGSQGIVMLTVSLMVLNQSKVMFDLGMGSWIADHVAYHRRSRVVGLTETSWALGLLIGVSVMGLVTAATNWRVGYLTGAAAVTVSALVVLARLPAHQAHSSLVPTARERTPLATRSWVIIGGASALMASAQCLFVTFGTWLEDDFGFTPATISAVVVGLGLGELLASVTSARRTDRWGKEWSAALGAAMIVPAGVALSLWHGHLGVGLVALAVGIGGFEFAIVSALAIGSNLVPGSPARGLGLMVGAGTMGRAIASVPATRWYDSGGVSGPALMAAGFACVTVIAMTTVHRSAVSTVSAVSAV